MSMLESVYHVPSPVQFEEVVTSTSSSASPPALTTLLDNDSSSDDIEGVHYIQLLQKHLQKESGNYCQTHTESCGSFCIKWLNFGEHLRQSRNDLQERKVQDSTDNITFACQQNVNPRTRRWVLHKAKRNVVMTTSLLLRNELQARPDDRPICLWDISSKTMTQVLHYIKHGIVFGPIREMNALIKANHILRVGAIWPDKYSYKLAALVGTSHNTNNKFRMSEFTPWIKTEAVDNPVEQYEEIHDDMFMYEIPNIEMDSKTANELPPSPLPPRRKSVIVDASEVWLPPKHQTKWFPSERVTVTVKESVVTPQTLAKPQRQWDVTSGPNTISPSVQDNQPLSTPSSVQPTQKRNIYNNIFTSPAYTTQTQYQQNSSKNFYSQVLSAFDKQSSLQRTNQNQNQNSTPPAPHNSPVDDNIPSSYEVITPPPQSTSCASVPAGVKMVSIYSTKQLLRSNNQALSPQTYSTLKPEMSVATTTTESSTTTTSMSKSKSGKSEATKILTLQGPNQTSSSAASHEPKQPPTIIPLPPFNQIKSSTPRILPEPQHFNQNPTPVLSHLNQTSSPSATLFGEPATSISGSHTRQPVTLPSSQVLPLMAPVLPQTLQPITPPPSYNTQEIILPSSSQSSQATSAAPMPRKKYIMALAYTQQTAQNNTNSNLCAQEIHTNQPTSLALAKRAPSTIPSSLQSTIIPSSSVQRPMPTPSPFPQGRFPFTKPQLALPHITQKHKTSYPDVAKQIMGPPPPKRPAKIPSTITSAEFHYNRKQTLQTLPQDESGNQQHHLMSTSMHQQSVSQQTIAVRMESFQKSQVVQRVHTTHNYPTMVTKLSQRVTANQLPQIDLQRQYFKTPHATVQFQQQQQQFQQQQRQFQQKQQQQFLQQRQFQQQRQQFLQQQRQQHLRHEQNEPWKLTASSTQRSGLPTRAHPYYHQTTYTASSVYGYYPTSTPPFRCKWCRCEKAFNTKLQLRFHFLFEHKSVESLRTSPTEPLKAGNQATDITDKYNYNYMCSNQFRTSRGSN